MKTIERPAPRFRFRHAVAGMLGIGVAVASVGLLLLELSIRPALESADRIKRGEVVTLETAKAIADGADDWALVRTCRKDVIRAVGLAHASAVGVLIANGDVERVVPALNALGRVATEIIRCDPREGMAWAWLAIVRDQTGGSTDDMVRLFETSQRMGPSEQWIIETRLPEAVRIMTRRGAALADVVRHDVRALMVGAEVGAAADIYGPVFDWAEKIGQEEYARIEDPKRREALLQAFGNWRANIAGCTRERFNDWLYRGQFGSCVDTDRIPIFDWKKGFNPT